jgi:hypothetical protein
MRTQLLLLASTLFIAACADNQQPTAPASNRSVSPKGSAAGQLAPSPHAKPTDQVGFTTIVRVLSSTAVSAPNTPAFALASCPSGTTLVGGGHQFVSFAPSAPPFVATSADNEANQWVVYVANSLPGAVSASFRAYAYCAS